MYFNPICEKRKQIPIASFVSVIKIIKTYESKMLLLFVAFLEYILFYIN